MTAIDRQAARTVTRAQCEWNPVYDTPATTPDSEDDCQNEITHRAGKFQLCERCARRPVFSRLKKVQIREAERPNCPGCSNTLWHDGECLNCEYFNLLCGRTHYCGDPSCHCRGLLEFMHAEVLERFRVAKPEWVIPPFVRQATPDGERYARGDGGGQPDEQGGSTP